MRVSRIRSRISSMSRASRSEWAAAVTAPWKRSSPSTPRPPASTSPGHLGDGLVDAGEVVGGTTRGGEGRDLRLEGVARVDDLGQPMGVGADRLDDAPRSRGLGEDGAVAVPDLDDADDLERDEGLAQGRAADAETLRELALGGQPVARREAVGLDPRTDLLGDLLVEPGSREAGQPRC